MENSNNQECVQTFDLQSWWLTNDRKTGLINRDISLDHLFYLLVSDLVKQTIVPDTYNKTSRLNSILIYSQEFLPGGLWREPRIFIETTTYLYKECANAAALEKCVCDSEQRKADFLFLYLHDYELH